MSSVFVDANIILDLIDEERGNKVTSFQCLKGFMLEGYKVYTSCDIFTTVYYIASKRVDTSRVIEALDELLKILQIIAIDANIIKQALNICAKDPKADFEDVLQYVCAKSVECEFIVSNDKAFYSVDVDVVGCE